MPIEYILIIVGASILLIGLIVLLCCLIKRSKNKKENSKTTAKEEQVATNEVSTKEEVVEEKVEEKVEEPKEKKTRKTTTKKTEEKTEEKPAEPKKTTKKSTKKVEEKEEVVEEQTQEEVQEKSTGRKGKFVYYKTAKGFYNFKLKAFNNETISVSGGSGYKSLTGCKAGMESLRKNVNAHIEDQTLKTFETLSKPKFELYKDKAEKYRYRLIAKNGEIICVSEGGYASKDSCKKGILSLAKWAPNAEVVKEEE